MRVDPFVCQQDRLRGKNLGSQLTQISFGYLNRKKCHNNYQSALYHLSKLFVKVFPGGNGGTFANNIFRIFDKDNNGFMDFKEFLMALDVTTCKTKEEKLEWAFRLYDIDGDGTINQDEMTTIIEILDDLGGMEVGEEYLVDGQPEVTLATFAF